MNGGDLALVAGEGSLPLEIVRSLKKRGAEMPKVYLLGVNVEDYAAEGVSAQRVNNPMAVALLLMKMRLQGVRRMMMAGTFPKRNIYAEEKMDSGAKNILSQVKDRNDHSLLAGVVSYLEKFGISVVSYEDIIPDMFAWEGHIGGPAPTQEQLNDSEYGLAVLRKLLPLSFGQSIVVSNRAVVAVEAMEGTDQMIRRAASLSRRGILLKGMRADQDRRYDLPVVGAETLRSMSQSGLSGLFVQAGSVLLLDREKFLQEAEELQISVTGVAPCQFL